MIISLQTFPPFLYIMSIFFTPTHYFLKHPLPQLSSTISFCPFHFFIGLFTCIYIFYSYFRILGKPHPSVNFSLMNPPLSRSRSESYRHHQPWIYPRSGIFVRLCIWIFLFSQIQTPMVEIKIGSLNCQNKLKRSFFSRGADNFAVSVAHILESERLDFLTVQELGFVSDTILVPSNLFKNYNLVVSSSPNSHQGNKSVGVFYHKRFSSGLLDVHRSVPGHLLTLRFQLAGSQQDTNHITVGSVYMPTNLEDADPSTEQCNIAMGVVRSLQQLWGPKAMVVVGGDFNECLHVSDRSSGRLGKYGCRFLKRLIGPLAYSDLSQQFDDSSHTRFGYANGSPSSAKLDRVLLTWNFRHTLRGYEVNHS